MAYLFFKTEKELMPFRFYDERTVSGRYDTVPVVLMLVGILVTLLHMYAQVFNIYRNNYIGIIICEQRLR